MYCQERWEESMSMLRNRMLLGLGALAAGTGALAVGPAVAENSPSFRDCSFAGGLDPDFLQLSGATVSPQGTLTVSPSQGQVQLEASESSDPGDSSGHDTLSVTVAAPNVPDRTVSGAGVGKVVLAVPLNGAAAGSSYTISWSATFDDGNHLCPSGSTPQNTTPKPFVLTVSAPASPGSPAATGTPTTPFAGARVTAHSITVRAGSALVPLSCPAGSGGCLVRLTLTTAHHHRALVGSARLRLAAGSTRKVAVKLTRASNSELRRTGQLSARAMVKARDGAGDTKLTSAAVVLSEG
jgi:hypothetical protein